MIAMVGVSQAATTNWKFNLGTSGILKNGYILDKTPTATPAAMPNQLFYVISAESVSQASLVSAFQASGGTFNLSSYAAKKYTAGVADGVISGNVNASGKLPAASASVVSSEDYTVGTSYGFYMAVIVDADSDGKYDYLYVSATKNAQTYDSSKTQSVSFAPGTSSSFIGKGAYSAAGWYGIPGDVPEPTSGVLMLLGFAGLALRRKRA